jgi:uncharacterized protein
MKIVFADTFYFYALLSKTDEAHAAAVEFTASYTGGLLTTDWVLTELADGLAATAQGRRQFVETRARLTSNPRVRVVPFDGSLQEAGIELYSQRADKKWTLTDCISFAVMRQEGLAEALTGDRHFSQAGFSALLSKSG